MPRKWGQRNEEAKEGCLTGHQVLRPEPATMVSQWWWWGGCVGMCYLVWEVEREGANRRIEVQGGCERQR